MVLQYFDTGSIAWSLEAYKIGVYFHLDLLIEVESFSNEPLFRWGPNPVKPVGGETSSQRISFNLSIVSQAKWASAPLPLHWNK